MNFYDTESLWQLFLQGGYRQVEFHEPADVYVINTCTVTQEGDRKSRQMIRRAARANPDAVVVVTGCYAQMSPGEALGIEGVDLVIGNQHRKEMLGMIERIEQERRPFNAVSDILGQKEFEDFDVPMFVDRTRASLKIEDGCNHFCTFCIIPYARGLVRSRKPDSVLAQAKRLSDAGYREIVLTGIHTGGYGEDLEGYALADLLTELEKIPQLGRIRVSSIEASEITDRLIEVLASSKKICRHLHIPLQSGHSEVLRRMNRHYTTEQYADRLRDVRKALPELAVTSDIIVGFPGETDAFFDTAMEFVRAQAFAELHVFPYSPRKGTPAAKFAGQVPEPIKQRRVERMIQLSDELQQTYNRQWTGRVLEVIPEETKVYDGKRYLIGHADNYMKIAFSGDQDLRGATCAVRVQKPGAEVSYGMLESVVARLTGTDPTLSTQVAFAESSAYSLHG